jgi:hypothetical protein
MIHSYAYRVGLIASAIGILYTLVAYFIGIEAFTNFLFPILIVIGILVYIILSVKKIKSFQGGNLTFASAFVNFMVMVGIYTIITQLFNYLLINIIDPEFGVAMADAIIEKTVNMMEGFGTPEQAIVKAIEDMEVAFEDQATISGMLLGVLKYLGFMAVIGLIVAAIMKSKKEVFTETVD